ncbi:hypothetical protein AKJ09_07535 [Labilithrix luteola]|uniref:Uncharacterized protein n=1 Tax=Labilithrix luteola TaxID=1391654 RepID=A0A0K1Q5E2_9BACT|nr:hypothetical protein AKJ09_03852 [Labilithrix luteola]AKU99035.1 hypothetical protein AKJ09_05699 [Labilithrix luteola]AKV00063.1 hypothetical protein AKJ09_06726 [Labilithrix luteola]AKV00872.1 hypothetical protein AKJ09_07535 [Labilithrix luteola]
MSRMITDSPKREHGIKQVLTSKAGYTKIRHHVSNPTCDLEK